VSLNIADCPRLKQKHFVDFLSKLPQFARLQKLNISNQCLKSKIHFEVPNQKKVLSKLKLVMEGARPLEIVNIVGSFFASISVLKIAQSSYPTNWNS
jgi:hypothetical protein